MGEVFDFRAFQTVRDELRKVELDPAPLFSKLRAAQRAGLSGNGVVGAAQLLRRQFTDELRSEGNRQ